MVEFTHSGTWRGLVQRVLVAWLLVLGLALPATAQLSGFQQALAEAASSDPALAAFYGNRGYEPIWTTGADANRRGAFFAALAAAPAHGLPAARYGAEALAARFSSLHTERDRARLEAAMSETLLTYARDVQVGVVTNPAALEDGLVRKPKRQDRLAILDGFAGADPDAFLRSLPPQVPEYAQLMRAKFDIEAALARGGWGPKVSVQGKLEPGATGPAVIVLRDRLIALGYLGRSASASYDLPLQQAVQMFQLDNGLTADGVAGETTMREVNRDPEERLRAIVVAMERLRWMYGTERGARHVWVNLPDFTAKIIDDGKVTFQTVTVVGQNLKDTRSPEFSDFMEHMVVNPSWNVPRSITVKEYLPMLQSDPNAVSYLQLIDVSGRVVDRSGLDFTQFDANTFPFDMKQAPSNSNALGLVKFMFPNPHNIYLHDTPSKSLFSRETRTFSHGCIRLQQPFDFAYTLLAAQSSDPQGLFARYLRTGQESILPLERLVPVHLVYFTAWPNAKGRTEFRRDIYGRDQAIYQALQNAGVALPSWQS
ncbi:L,D-transpeptidase family protein [Phaeovulum sp.]|uniref:L,D-transpeptidase family protein n=1 Tax=Phaeovulum sp. TaxID=2934796 RepID=UPI0027300E4D|nr:L,D-transpeptidase family protein [Phaeovulum sp.]MDP1669472.1 L,D-transpeptidase family protein [Phaeovulum sp.]MDZ4118249.1 L,D-transpeptidase family protein [Phaeovulum sp.]